MPVRHVQTMTLASANTVAAWVPLDIYQKDFEVAYAVNATGNGGVRYAVQFTLDNVLEAGVSAVARDLVSAQTAAGIDGTVQSPITAIRVQVSASSSVVFSFRVLQGG